MWLFKTTPLIRLCVTCLNQIAQEQNASGMPVVVAGLAEGIP